MIERIEHFSSELNLEALPDRESLNESKVDIPVVGRAENVSAGTILTGCRNAEKGRRILATRQCRRGGKDNWPNERLPSQIL